MTKRTNTIGGGRIAINSTVYGVGDGATYSDSVDDAHNSIPIFGTSSVFHLSLNPT